MQVVPSSVWTKTTAATAAKYGNHIARQQQHQQWQRHFSCRLATLAKTASTTTPSSSLSSLLSPLQVFHLPRSTPPQQQHLQHLQQHLQQQQHRCHRWLSSDATKSTSEGGNGGAGAGDASQASTTNTAPPVGPEAGGTAEEDDEAAAAAAEAAAESEMDNTTTTTQQQDQLQQQIDELQRQAQATKDQLLRSLAEQENIRSIARRDVDAAKQFSIKSFAKALLDVADNLERALSHIDKTELESNPSLKTLYEGIDMTSTGLTKALESNGVKAYCHEPGDNFDPTLHEALMEFPDPSKSPGTVGLVMKKGYMLNNRVLRPAEVGVIKK